MKAFAENLKKARRIKGWSQDQAAAACGRGRPIYAAWEEGRARPKYEDQLIIVDTFGIKDWKGFAESDDFDHVQGMRPAKPEASKELVKALKENYNQADAKTRLAVNILLNLVEVE